MRLLTVDDMQQMRLELSTILKRSFIITYKLKSPGMGRDYLLGKISSSAK